MTPVCAYAQVAAAPGARSLVFSSVPIAIGEQTCTKCEYDRPRLGECAVRRAKTPSDSREAGALLDGHIIHSQTFVLPSSVQSGHWDVLPRSGPAAPLVAGTVW